MRAALRVFWRSLQYWSDEALLLVQMNAAWLLAVLLVIPGPPATAALLEVTNRMAHGERAGWRTARRAFRRYFWKSWGWAIITLAFVGILTFNYTYYSRTTTGVILTLARIAWVIFALTGIAVQFYWWPLVIEMRGHPLIPALRNAARLAMLNSLFTITLLVVVLAFVAASAALVAPALLMLSGLLTLVVNHATLDRLAAYREMLTYLEEEETPEVILEGISPQDDRPVVTPRPPKPRSRRAQRRRARKSARKKPTQR